MPDDLLLMLAALFLGGLVGHVRYKHTRPKYGPPYGAPVTHESLYWPTVFPPWALAHDEPEDDSRQQLHQGDHKDTDS